MHPSERCNIDADPRRRKKKNNVDSKFGSAFEQYT